MNEIPDDIRETARQMAQVVADRYVEPLDVDLMMTFAEALLAERERCAKIAEIYPAFGNRAIASAIRAPSRSPAVPLMGC